MASNISVNHDIHLRPQERQTIQQSTAQRSAYPMYAHGTPSDDSDGQFSLTKVALAEVQNRTSLDVEAGFARNRLSFWDIAGSGLAKLSNVTGDPLTVEKERADDGRITQFALGDRFSFSRR